MKTGKNTKKTNKYSIRVLKFRDIKDAFGLTILILEQASPFGRMKRLICLLHRLPPKPRTASGFEWEERKCYGAINLVNFAELSRFE
jgi:hypothetical protein